MMFGKTFLVLGIGLLVGVGLTPSISADDTGPVRSGFALTSLDSVGKVGQYTSVTIGADGLGLISYRDVTARALKVAHCSNAACRSATPITTLDDPANDVGQYTSVTIGADRLGLISYHDVTPRPQGRPLLRSSLHGRHHDYPRRPRQRSWVSHTSVTIGADGLGLISYHDVTNGTLKVAHCNNAACTGATITTLDSPGNVWASTPR